MSTKLEFHLYPKGRSSTEPDLMPSVLDSEGNSVLFTSAKRKTTEATVVDLGDSPNSNNGDPLRTAFAKINNFIEASYWTNESINQKFRDIDSELNEGISIYTDSDQRVDISLLENTKLKFSGTDNQIETNIQSIKSLSNTTNFDSEVIINFQLASTLEVEILNVNEFFSIVDSDGNVRVSYSTVDYPTTLNERLQNGTDAVFNIGTNVVLGRDSDDVLIVNSRIASNLIPYGDEIYNLGDSDNKWRDLWLSGNTIHLGSIQIKNFNGRGLTLLDSDGQTLDLRINAGQVSTLTVDSDMLVDGLTRLLGDLVVSQNARFDSDVTVKGLATFDSDVVIKGVSVTNKFASYDSDVNRFDSDINLLVAKVGEGNEYVLAALDSDVAILTSRIDSDFARFDSDIKLLNEKVGLGTEYVLKALDSDVAILTSRIDSDFARFDSDVSKLVAELGGAKEYLLKALDSDVNILTTRIDSDYRHYMDNFYWTWQRLDSESVKVQQLKTDFEDIILDDPVVAEVDRAAKAGKVPILNSIARFDKSVMPLDVPLTVNGIVPDAAQNIVLNLTSTALGPRDGRPDSDLDGAVWIVDNTDSEAAAAGTLYIFSDYTRSWQRIVGFTVAENDARYVNVTGDTMLAPLYLAADPVGANEASNKHYIDSLDSDSNVLVNSLQIQITDNDSDILYLQTFIDGGIF